MITVRELRTRDDLNAVLNLCRVFFNEYAAYHDGYFDTEEISDSDIAGRFHDSLESDRDATIIAIDNDKIVGYALIAIREQPSFYKVKKVGAISGLMVAKQYRRRGIGAMLVAEIRSYFKARGIKFFTLYTAVANKEAAEFYKNEGLTPLQTVFVGEV